jgi:predicted flavoprotein YhiN
MTPWQPANCGWEVAWPREFLDRAEGKPLKNLTVTAGDESVSGELLVTKYGLEGGAIYRLGRILRGMREPAITIDFKPQLTIENLRDRAVNLANVTDWFRAWKLSDTAVALLESSGEEVLDVDRAIDRVKKSTVRLQGPRPIAEAISSAGGVPWSELDETLMLRKAPGVFVAGEMIDWEAPTGGYLLQGCFATGTRAGAGAARWTARSGR